MRYLALAADYDGTLAMSGSLSAEANHANIEDNNPLNRSAPRTWTRPLNQHRPPWWPRRLRRL